MRKTSPKEFKSFREYKKVLQPHNYKKKSLAGKDPVEFGTKLAIESLAKNIPIQCNE